MASIEYKGPGNRCLPYGNPADGLVCNLIPGANAVPDEVARAVLAAHPTLFDGPRPRLVATLEVQDVAPTSLPEAVEPAPESDPEAVLVEDEEPRLSKRGSKAVKS